MELKTVAELAKELQVSKVTIYNHVNNLDKRIHITKKNNVTYVKPDGQKIIKERLANKQNVSPKNQKDSIDYELLKNQLVEKDKQIESLQKLLDQQQQLQLNTQQQLEHYKETLKLQEPESQKDKETIRELEQELIQERNKTVFQRLIERFKRG